ncbi:MAG: thioredoxin-dependent thiol peroxidase [Rickettsiales bacterium]|nr:MAG: thioredoxin-dependent thiol peroxidase [Rickettsiales bacterium]
MTNLKIGDIAPNFSITDNAVADTSVVAKDGSATTLSDFAGKYVVLYFYPKDDTPGCTVQARGFNSLLKEFNDLGAEIIGISKDDLKSHEKFTNKYDLQFPLVPDTDMEICKKYGVWVEKSMFGKKYMGINRESFLIDPEGKIVHIWPKVSVLKHAAEVLAKLKEFV